MHYILLDSKTVAALTKNNNKRAICTINNTLQIHCAILNNKELGNFIQIGATNCKQLKIKAGDTIEASFVVDDTQYQFEMPEELREVLLADPEAHKIFHDLSAGNQRSLIYLISLVKSSDKKIERALLIAEKIKVGVVSARLVLKK
jgi:uncharacterized protein YdeI (YjbR/CyaY-like superfamily)